MNPTATTAVYGTFPRLALAGGLVAAGVFVTFDVWKDILNIAVSDEEASHIFLVPAVIAWLIWNRHEELRSLRLGHSLIGPVIIAGGWIISSIGFYNRTQTLWHGGAVIVAVGCLVTVAGGRVLWRMPAAFIVLAFLVPVPGMVRQQIAIPLQTATAIVTEFIFVLLSLAVERHGNVLWYNGVQVAVAEACNGMRMVFALVLVTYAVAFATPLLNYARVLILVLSPVFAIACNVLRMIPTVWIFGHYPKPVGKIFHDLSGWVMIAAAFVMVMAVIRVLRWAEIPVMQRPPPPRR